MPFPQADPRQSVASFWLARANLGFSSNPTYSQKSPTLTGRGFFGASGGYLPFPQADPRQSVASFGLLARTLVSRQSARRTKSPTLTGRGFFWCVRRDSNPQRRRRRPRFYPVRLRALILLKALLFYYFSSPLASISRAISNFIKIFSLPPLFAFVFRYTML